MAENDDRFPVYKLGSEDQVSTCLFVCLFVSCILSNAYRALSRASYGGRIGASSIHQVFRESQFYVWPSRDDKWTTDPYLRECGVS